MHTRSLSRAALLAFLVAACSESPTQPSRDKPQFDYANGPADLANVVRQPYGLQGVGFYDAGTDLWIFAAPFSPACGTDYTAFLNTTVQDAGVLKGAVNTLEMGRLFLSVFRGYAAGTMCASTLVGTGVGRFMYVDNDKQASGTRTNTWSWRMNGQLQLEDGSTASLVATFRFTARDGQTLEHAHVIRLTPSR